MWYRIACLAVICLFAATQPGWAQQGKGGRNQEEAIRKLEQEVAHLRTEIKKLQTDQKQYDQRRSGASAIENRRAGEFRGRGSMAFRGQQFGPPRWNQPFGRQGFRPGQFHAWRFQHRRPGDFRQFNRPGFGRGPAHMPRPGQPPHRDGFRGPEKSQRGEAFAEHRSDRVGPSAGRSNDARPTPERRPRP